MTVLHIITGLNVGGAENMLAKLLESTPDSARTAVVLSLLEPGPIAERIRACGVRIETLHMARGIGRPGDAIRLGRAVRRIAPDVIHGWMYHGNLAASLARIVLGPKAALVWNVRHSLADIRRESRSTRILLRISALISRQADAIVYNSHAALDQHSRFGFAEDRARVLPNGFDCQRFWPDPAAASRLRSLLGIAPEATVVGHVARLHPMKDQAMLIRAVALAREQGVDLHLVMVGAGFEAQPSELRSLAECLLPQDRVSLLGARGDIAELMPGFDLLALSSAWGEAFPNVLGEALACGVPAVSTAVGDSAAIVGDSGRVVQPGDADAFSGALRELADLPVDQRRALGMAGRKRVESQFAIGAISNSYRRLHEELIASKRAGGRSLTALSGAV